MGVSYNTRDEARSHNLETCMNVRAVGVSSVIFETVTALRYQNVSALYLAYFATGSFILFAHDILIINGTSSLRISVERSFKRAEI